MPFVTANQNPVATGDALCKAEKTHNWYLLCFLLFVDTENFMTIDRRYFLITELWVLLVLRVRRLGRKAAKPEGKKSFLASRYR